MTGPSDMSYKWHWYAFSWYYCAINDTDVRALVGIIVL
jgi:hypothetical protein